jgi:outer membrane immunogenic protein
MRVMKKTISGLIISCAFCALAYAGPEQFSGKEMKQVAPAPPPCPNWTGFYVGGFGGYKFGVIDPRLSLTGDWGDMSAVTSRANHDLNTSGAELGGVIGYNYEWNKWVFGMEAAGGYLWLRDSSATGTFDAPGGNYHIENSFKTHYLLTVGPRFGYAFCRWLPYVTGGLAVGDLDFEQRFFSSDFFGELRDSASETNFGWFLGGGMEYALTDHWRVRAQYQYIDLGDVGFKYSNPVNDAFITKGSSSLAEHNASFAIVYGF